VAGRPEHATHVETKASAQLEEEMSFIGAASIQLYVDLSIMVRRQKKL
jgi:hypothetical protein